MTASAFDVIRVGQSARGTFGVLRHGQVPFALTMERPWVDNAVRFSCIPAGTYVCRRVQSPKFGETFEITGVPGRTHILFHKGNRLDETEGCILVGEEFGGTAAQPLLASSARGYGELMARLTAVDEFSLTIVHGPEEV